MSLDGQIIVSSKVNWSDNSLIYKAQSVFALHHSLFLIYPCSFLIYPCSFLIYQKINGRSETNISRSETRVRRDSCLGLNFSYFSVQISRLGLVLVSKHHFMEFSVSSRSRKIILQNSRSRLVLESRFIKKSRLASSLGFLE